MSVYLITNLGLNGSVLIIMYALYSPVLPSDKRPIEDQKSHIYKEADTLEALVPHFSPSEQRSQLRSSASFVANCKDPPATTVKKLHRNARERDRRKKINILYSSLRSLLPASQHKKKLSIPAVVSLVLKYIPELQEQVEKFVAEKEEVSSRVSGPVDFIHQTEEIRRSTGKNCLSSISANWLNARELVIQISAYQVQNVRLSEILFTLEEDDLLLINASSFESIGGIVFYNLHLQLERTRKLECEIVVKKLLSLYQKREESPL